MSFNRRNFLRGLGLASAGAALGPLIKIGKAHGAPEFKAKRVVVVSVAGGLRLREALGMAEGATMPNMLGDVPLISGFGSGPAGPVKAAPEYLKAMPAKIVLPAPRTKPLFSEGALITNLRYAEGAPGHLQGAACLVSGAYNNIDNRGDAHAPSPTLFEIHRRASNAPATDAWYMSVAAGFYRALQASDHPDYGAPFGGSWLSPGGMMTPFFPILTSGKRKLAIDGSELPSIQDGDAARTATRKLSAVLDTGVAVADDGGVHGTQDENSAVEAHLAALYADPTYQKLFPQSFGIGMDYGSGQLVSTGDTITTYHAEQVLSRFKPSVMVLSLIDVDACHTDYNGYLLNQGIADACVAHLWDFIQSTPGLAGETAMLVLPEHGRQLEFNGKNPDSLGRSGLDHGAGDDGDRDVFMLALGPDFKPGVYSPTNVTQKGRNSGRYESIDAVMTAASLLGYGDTMSGLLSDANNRPGLLIKDILK